VVAELSADLGVHRGDFSLDLELEIGTGEVVALLGPNGAGKSTALRALEGLLQITSGKITVGGQVVADAGRRYSSAPARAPYWCGVSGLPAVSTPHGARQCRVRATRQRIG
jgi:ABC-type sulfate/molybdate transport systems ATPase subunit